MSAGGRFVCRRLTRWLPSGWRVLAQQSRWYLWLCCSRNKDRDLPFACWRDIQRRLDQAVDGWIVFEGDELRAFNRILSFRQPDYVDLPTEILRVRGQKLPNDYWEWTFERKKEADGE